MSKKRYNKGKKQEKNNEVLVREKLNQKIHKMKAVINKNTELELKAIEKADNQSKQDIGNKQSKEIVAQKEVKEKPVSAKKISEQKINNFINEDLSRIEILSVKEYVFKNRNINNLVEQNFWSEFLQKQSTAQERIEIADLLLDKIDVFYTAQKKIQVKLNMLHDRYQDKNFDMNKFQAKSLFIKAEALLEKSQIKENSNIVFYTKQEAVKALEKSYMIYQLLNKNYIKEVQKYINKIQILFDKILSEESDYTQYLLVLDSLKLRNQNLPENENCLIDILIKLASYGVKVKIDDIRLNAMDAAVKAYNIINKNLLDSNSAKNLIEVLVHMKDMFSDVKGFYDLGKSQILAKQIDFLHNTFLEQKNNDNNIKEQPFEFTPIVEINHTELPLQLKQQMQKDILDKIQLAASKGKWTEKYGIVIERDYGVSGYIDKQWLIKQIPSLKQESNYEVALEICFEAINIGIMNSSDKNPLCAQIFAQKYPEIVQKVVKEYPQYLVDGYILKTSIINASAYSEKLIQQKLEQNKDYNKFYEDEIIRFVEQYGSNSKEKENSVLQKQIIQPITEVISSRNSTKSNVELTIKQKLDEKNLKNAFGNNLTQVKDFYSVVRLLVFKEIINSIIDNELQDYSPISFFQDSFPELSARIYKDHNDYYRNDKGIELTVNNFISNLHNIDESELGGVIDAENISNDII